jgi:hypothetical protein
LIVQYIVRRSPKGVRDLSGQEHEVQEDRLSPELGPFKIRIHQIQMYLARGGGVHLFKGRVLYGKD